MLHQFHFPFQCKITEKSKVKQPKKKKKEKEKRHLMFVMFFFPAETGRSSLPTQVVNKKRGKKGKKRGRRRTSMAFRSASP